MALVVDELCKASQSQCKLYSICHIYLAYTTKLGHIWEAEKCLFYGCFWVDVASTIPVASLWGLYNPLRWIWGKRWGKSSPCSPLRRDTIGAAKLRGVEALPWRVRMESCVVKLILIKNREDCRWADDIKAKEIWKWWLWLPICNDLWNTGVYMPACTTTYLL